MVVFSSPGGRKEFTRQLVFGLASVFSILQASPAQSLQIEEKSMKYFSMCKQHFVPQHYSSNLRELPRLESRGE